MSRDIYTVVRFHVYSSQNSKFKFSFRGIQVCVLWNSSLRFVEFKFASKESSLPFVESSLRFVEFKFASKESSLRFVESSLRFVKFKFVFRGIKFAFCGIQVCIKRIKFAFC